MRTVLSCPVLSLPVRSCSPPSGSLSGLVISVTFLVSWLIHGKCGQQRGQTAFVLSENRLNLFGKSDQA